MKIVTPEFRVSYPHLFKAKLNDLNGKEEYSVVALFKKGEDLSLLKKAAQEAIMKKWGSDKTKWPANLKSPFRDQKEREKDGALPGGHEAGAIFMNFKSKEKPQVVDANVQPILDESEFYAGCYARASVNAYAYDQKGNRGVAFGLGNIQFVKDGDPLGGRTRASDDFESVAGADSDANGESAPGDLF